MVDLSLKGALVRDLKHGSKKFFIGTKNNIALRARLPRLLKPTGTLSDAALEFTSPYPDYIFLKNSGNWSCSAWLANHNSDTDSQEKLKPRFLTICLWVLPLFPAKLWSALYVAASSYIELRTTWSTFSIIYSYLIDHCLQIDFALRRTIIATWCQTRCRHGLSWTAKYLWCGESHFTLGVCPESFIAPDLYQRLVKVHLVEVSFARGRG